MLAADAVPVIVDAAENSKLMSTMYIAGLVHAQVDSAGGRERIQCIGNQIGENLAHIARKTKNAALATEVSLDGDLFLLNSPLIQVQHGFHNVRYSKAYRTGCLPVKAQCLSNDVGDSCQFLLGHLGISPGTAI